ncbi:MAG: undecaprenyl-diphosphatase UppP [Patescibacteria group bacterium]|jgi:undecaprenyl-diphosphatase
MLEHYFSVVILSIIQGITEFVPISSSGHLIILHNILPELKINELAFDVFLHAGTLLAVIVFFWPDLVKIFINWLKNSLKMNFRASEAKLGWLLIIATIPAGLFGYFFEDLIENFLRSNLVVAAMLIIVGLLFLLAEHYFKRQQMITQLNWKNALFIGIAQAIALIPGTSRSGITIIAGMASKLKREEAVRFSFLISVPVILGATIKKIPAISAAIFDGNLLNFSMSAVISFVTAYFIIKYLLIYVKNHSLNIFAYYRFFLAAVIILLYFI